MEFGWLKIIALASVTTASPLIAQASLADNYARWENQLRTRINDQLFYPEAANGAAGDVLVRFGIGRDGKPADMVVERSSGQPIFDRAAVELVSRLGRLGPVPSATRSVRSIVVKISYGDPSRTVRESMKLARADMDEQLANQRRNGPVVSTSSNSHLAAASAVEMDGVKR